MQKLPFPTDEVLAVFQACTSLVRNVDLRERLTSIEDAIENASVLYQEKAENGELYTIQAVDNVAGKVSKDEMTDLYNFRMVRTKTPGRAFYDKLISAPKFGRCPLCAQRTVSTLDHHLAKAHHPSFAVAPCNLVPSCSDCNRAKEHEYAQTAEQQTLHPYFDDIEDEMWLTAIVEESAPPSLLFSVSELPDLDPIMRCRIQHHFEVFKLGRLYGSHSGSEIVSINSAIKNIFNSEGADGVRSHLSRQAQSYSGVNPNSWQAVMYRTLAASDWYCEGGFFGGTL